MPLHLTHPNQKFDFSAVPALEHDFFLNDASTYLPSTELTAAVNVALQLEQPLLLTGEPGTGKTGLAHFLAYRFDLAPAIVFDAQTVSSKKDLFYHYDALAHFQWAQVNRQESKPLTREDFEENLKLIRYDGLGDAIRRAQLQGKRSVVLIDEIDKAPRDLPNDLLAAIENLSFEVPEITSEKVRYTCPKDLRPVIIITSNSEKNLPDAFLRRVVYFHIPFPKREELLNILSKKFKNLGNLDVEAVADYFLKIRDAKNLAKDPATAELISWASLLARIGFPTQKLRGNVPDNLTDIEREQLRLANSVLAKTKADLIKLNSVLGIEHE